MLAIVCVSTCMCMNQYVCMSDSMSFPLSSTSKVISPLATDAGVCILSVDPTSSMHRGGGGWLGGPVLFKEILYLYI